MRRWIVVGLAALLPLGCTDSGSDGDDDSRPTTPSAPPTGGTEAGTSPTEPAGEREYLLVSPDDLRQLPAEGPEWDALVLAARGDLDPDLSDQDRTSSAALAAALVYARTGEEEFRLRVEAALAGLPGTEEDGRTLSLGRQLAGWVIAADLVGYRDPSFLRWLDDVRTLDIGGHGRWRSLVVTHETTATNWGTLAGASRIAVSRYLGDDADVDRAAEVLRGWTGERAGPVWPTLPEGAEDEHGFLPSDDFDPSWACDYPTWTPVNPACGDRGGALVEDISRGDSYPEATETGLRYTWEAMQGALLQAVLLAADGRSEVWGWGDEALRRALDFLQREGGFDEDAFDALHHWVPVVIDAVYGTSYAAGPAGAGRSFGFADWLAPVLGDLASR